MAIRTLNDCGQWREFKPGWNANTEASNCNPDEEFESIDLKEIDDEYEQGDDSSDSWTSRGYQRLLRLIKKAKGAASQPVLTFIRHYMLGTKLIFVMGQTGTGKTTLLQELTGLELKVGNTMNSVCPAILDGEQYLFVDTAGFGAADLDDTSTFKDILSCLHVLGPLVTVAGVLFVYGSPRTRISQADLRTVRWMQCFCGPGFFRNMTIVTSQWDGLSSKGVKKTFGRLESLLDNEDVSRILNPPGRHHGGHVYHHGFPNGKGSADAHLTILDMDEDGPERGCELRDLIRPRYASVDPAQLQIVSELEDGVPVHETQAAKVLRSDLTKTVIQIVNDLAVLRVICDDDDKPLPKSDALQLGSSTEQPTSCQQIIVSDSSEEKAATETTALIIGRSPKPKVSLRRKSLLERAWEWINIALGSAQYFEEAQRMGHESSNQEESRPGPIWSFVNIVTKWWWGPFFGRG